MKELHLHVESSQQQDLKLRRSSFSEKSTYLKSSESKKKLTEVLSDECSASLQQSLAMLVFQEKESLSSQALQSVPSIDVSEALSDLFLKILETLSTVHKDGISETTLTLSASNASALFAGTEVTITEYTTAPKVFNIQILTQGEAFHLCRTHAATLKQMLGKEQDFSVHRIEVDHQNQYDGKKDRLIQQVTEMKRMR